MMRGRERKGKILMMSGGSRSRSQARAEDTARRSRKRAEKLDALRQADELIADFFAFEAATRGPDE
jgi:hypothetical protein